MLFSRCFALTSSLTFLFLSCATLEGFSEDYEESLIRNTRGDLQFLVRFYPGSAPKFSQNEITTVKNGFTYWANVLIPAPNSSGPGRVWVNKNASITEYNPKITDGLFQAIMGQQPRAMRQSNDPHGEINLGQREYNIPPAHKKFNLYTTTVHEIGHGLIESPRIGDPLIGVMLTNNLSSFQKGLINGQSKAPIPNQVLCPISQCLLGCYDVSSGLWFVGNTVKDVLTTKGLSDLRGIPVNSDFSHIELKQSLMSHQNYRNYDRFMEAELALLKDIGWHINLRNYYGYSLYGNNRVLTNSQRYGTFNFIGPEPYTIYANDTDYATGVHIYGSHNTLTQRGFIRSNGKDFIGIRVDGVGNT